MPRRPRPRGPPAASYLDPAIDRVDHPGDRILDRDAIVLVTVAVAERDRAFLDVAVAGNHHEGHLLQLRIADLLLHPVVGLVDLNPDTPLAQAARHLGQVLDVALGHRDAHHLHRGEPGRERTRVVLDQHPEEPLDRTELGGVDHHRLLTGAVSGDVLYVVPLRLGGVVLYRQHLPGAADGVARLDGDLRTVERGTARVRH